MIKHILIAVTTALLVLPNLSSTILAGPPEVPDVPEGIVHGFQLKTSPTATISTSAPAKSTGAMPGRSPTTSF